MESIGHKSESTVNPDRIEVSVFGAGFGECVVVHLGENEWCIINSCLEEDGKTPVALKYLEAIGVNVETEVVLVLATHWHDDHIGGLGEIYKRSKRAVFCCSAAMNTPEFDSVMATWFGTRWLAFGSGVDEFAIILKELKSRTGGQFPSPILASARKMILNTNKNRTVEIEALSPSDATIMLSGARFLAGVARSGSARIRMPNPGPNDLSVVLRIRINDQQILLGADLEVNKNRSFGWLSVVDLKRNTKKSGLYKISHHGSEGADDDEIWRELLDVSPFAVITPFVRGKVALPRNVDCNRILGWTPKAYITSPSRGRRLKLNNKTVEKAVYQTAKSIYVPGKSGHVRFTKSVNSTKDLAFGVDLLGDARVLSKSG